MAGRLGDILVTRGVITEEQLENALVSGQRGMLGETLMSRGLITTEQLGSALEEPVVNQLVLVGERTGTLSKTTVHIRAHLRREVEAYTNLMVGTIEPVTAVGLAGVIGCILLAIYLPMFDMISAMG